MKKRVKLINKKVFRGAQFLLIPLLLVGCTQESSKNSSSNERNHYGDFVSNTTYSFEKELNTIDIDEFELLRKLDSQGALKENIIIKKDNTGFNNQSKKVVETKVGDFVKLDINIIYDNSGKNVEFVYLTKYVNPKLNLILDNVQLKENHSHKFGIFGDVIITKENLTDEELSDFEEYAKSYPKRIRIENDYIIFSFSE